MKKVNDSMFKFNFEIENKIREKIDKRDLEDIESKFLII